MALPAIWKCDSYQEFMKGYMKSLPHNGRGYSTKVAKALGIHPTLFSQILQGHRDLTLEQASLFCDHIHFSEKDSELFLKLVEFSRAGNESLRSRIRRQLDGLKSEYKEVRAHVGSSTKELSEEEKSIFYSSWHYSAFRMMCSLRDPLSVEEIAAHLQISGERAKVVETFLLRTGLIVETDGRLNMGPFNTHVRAESAWSTRHHLNWRTRNLNKIEHITKEELSFTAPFSCSAKDFKRIKESILELIKETSSVVGKTTPEHVYTLCIDLMNV
jgi:uncharacterized protein (TIGR02147 family)